MLKAHKALTLLLGTMCLLLCSAEVARADFITVGVNPSSGLPGSILTFHGYIFNSSTQPVAITHQTMQISSPFIFSPATDFLVPSGTIIGPSEFLTGNLFRLTISPAFHTNVPLLFSGFYTAGGFIDGTLQTYTAVFTVTILPDLPPPDPIPEPATLLLLGTGLAGTIGALKRRAARGKKDTL